MAVGCTSRFIGQEMTVGFNLSPVSERMISETHIALGLAVMVASGQRVAAVRGEPFPSPDMGAVRVVRLRIEECIGLLSVRRTWR